MTIVPGHSPPSAPTEGLFRTTTWTTDESLDGSISCDTGGGETSDDDDDDNDDEGGDSDAFVQANNANQGFVSDGAAKGDNDDVKAEKGNTEEGEEEDNDDDGCDYDFSVTVDDPAQLKDLVVKVSLPSRLRGGLIAGHHYHTTAAELSVAERSKRWLLVLAAFTLLAPVVHAFTARSLFAKPVQHQHHYNHHHHHHHHHYY